MRKSKRNKFSFKIESKRLADFSKMDIMSRMKWLDETNRFISSIKDKSLKSRIRSFKEARVY